ncbi:MAG TPA: cobalt transporter CbiM [Gammaproteobacteria bacterium]|nr:cobalt transporter CbiM [Gammaproteobacteria bacterium]
MHISDGILSAPVLVSGFVGTAAIAAVTLRNMDLEEIPKISVITAIFFVASLLKVPIGPTSIHLILSGLVGIVLGWRAFPAVLLGLILQALLFGHGGVTVIGVNAIMLGGGALASAFVWQQRFRFKLKKPELIFGAIAGATGVIFSGIVLAGALMTAGEAFIGTAYYVLAVHIPIIIIEAAIVGIAAEFLHKVKPEILFASTSSDSKPGSKE